MTHGSLLRPEARFAAESPGFPVRFPPQEAKVSVAESVVRASIAGEDERGLTLCGVTQTGENVSIAIQIVAPGIVRALLERDADHARRTTFARALTEPVEVSLERSDGQIIAMSDLVNVVVQLDPFHLAFKRPDGRVLLEQNHTETYVTGDPMTLPLGFSSIGSVPVAFHETFTAEPDEHFYGFGEKFTDFDKRGQWLEMWQYDAFGVNTERAYKNVPFFISTRGYGLFVDSASCVNFDMAASSNATFSLIVPDSALDYYFIAGPDPKTIITRYASLVSFPILPPKWAFGLWVSSGFKRDTAQEVLERGRQLRERDIPCDVLHLDCFWQRHGRWSEMLWDREVFPDPEGMIKDVKEMGFRVCLWINPYMGQVSERFAEARAKGYLLKMPDSDACVVNLWGGSHPPVGVVDMTNPEAVAWFKDLLRPLLRMGVDVFKTDFGEGVPAYVIAWNGMNGAELHNLYPLLYNDAVAEVTVEETDHTGLVWGRSTYAGGQRHAAQWGGDPNCTFQALASTLRGGLSMAMCGHAFWSHDIGGFRGQPTPELYVRWAQLGLLSPLSRAHGTTTRLPWEYGEDAERIFRDYVRLRYRLLPYIYTYASIAAETSLPLLRPMVLEFPDDPSTYTMDLQYLFGSEILVAPIYNDQGRRPVYFPAGRWVDFWTHQVIEGPRTCYVDAPLHVLPLYVRANALIPTIEPPDFLTDAPFESVTFEGYLLDRGNFELRDTDGVTTISAALQGARLDIRTSGAKDALGFRLIPLPGASGVESVHVNGDPVAMVSGVDTSPSAPAGWTRDEDGKVHVTIRR